ncbi:hypothetical protein GWO43_16095 [candidate division KSB1 bacterium]|nr:hypothetical protein [candidate division KSB1 bacterium]NIV68755.1 hypothetical protein [Phycisphaerae bacterium]NIS25472.1 hypothetical protein [candidate division KSB1 bacterium]NIT72365.1 hypothetical protein [candidate division KSB1 bacterium]NIU26149.1 hypothetical protein [candidate division KSB1 bacterium]
MKSKYTEKQIENALALYKETGNFTFVSKETGIPRSTIRDWCRLKDIHVEKKIPDSELARKRVKLQDENARLIRENRSLLRQLNEKAFLDDFINDSFAKKPPAKTFKFKHEGGISAPEIPVLFHSDTQYGEVINLEDMDGLNSFDANICEKRMQRMFQKSIEFTTEHWAGPKPDTFFYLRGGDHISGGIHDELAETDEKTSIESILEMAAIEKRGIDLIQQETGCKVIVYSVAGNHGRTTRRPRTKRYSALNYDYLLAKMLENQFIGNKNVIFHTPQSGDAYFNIFDFWFLLTHGDRIGARGGMGFLGPAAPIIRGMKKVIEEFSSQHRYVYKVLLGHFHTALDLEYGLANGCVPGPSEYSRSIMRAKPHPPSQWYFKVHPRHGITTTSKLYLGSPEEGRLYE